MPPKIEKAVVERVAHDPWMILIGRTAAIALVPISIFIGSRLLDQLDTTTKAVQVVAQQLAVTSSLLDGIARRVEGLEDRERGR